MLKLTEKLVEDAFLGMKDLSEEPYIDHLRAVVEGLPADADDELKMIAWLHDLIEDTSWNIPMLLDLGYSSRVLLGVQAMTHTKNIPYALYLTNVKANPDARIVKLSDLKHNMKMSRIYYMCAKDLRRLRKYKKAKKFLEDV